MEEKKPLTAAAKWQQQNIRQFKMNLNRTSDADIIERLDSRPEGVAPYLKRLVREDMEKEAP